MDKKVIKIEGKVEYTWYDGIHYVVTNNKTYVISDILSKLVGKKVRITIEVLE